MKGNEVQQRAITALRVWRDRSLQCLRELEEGRLEDFLVTQKKQNIAFLNFQSLDHIAKCANIDVSACDEAKNLEVEIQAAIATMTRLHSALHAEHQERLEKLSKATLGIRHYGRTHKKAKFIRMI